MNDLTRGNVAKQLIGYAVPLMLISVLQALYSIIDLVIVGQFVGSRGIVAVTNAGQVVSFLSQIIISITVGGNVLVGKYYGSREDDQRKESAGTLCVFSLLLGVAFAVTLYLLAAQSMTLLGAPAHDEAIAYIRICAIGFIPVFGYHALSAILRGVGDSKGPMNCIVLSTIVNVVLDLLFVKGFSWGVTGAAVATFLAQVIAFLVILFYYAWPNRQFLGITRRYLTIAGDKLLAIVKVGLPVAGQQAIIAVSWLYVLYVINSFGMDISAGYGVSAKIRDFVQLVITAMMTGTSTMIAQCLGAKDYQRAQTVMFTALKMSIAMTTVMILFVEVCAGPLVACFTSDPAVAEVAITNLRIEIMGQWFFSVFYMYHALAIGAGHTLFITINSFLNCIVVRITAITLLRNVVGIQGIYWILMLSTSVSILPAILYERSGVWKKGHIKTVLEEE